MNLSEAAQKLWNLDANRLTPNQDYTINVQSGKKPYYKEDTAPDPLFESVNDQVWQRPTFSAFLKLLDNYSANVGTAETVTEVEKAEIQTFLEAVLQTAPMKYCHEYCHEKDPDRVPGDVAGFSQLLYSIWFELYSRQRGGRLDSSGFEHVFVGEVNEGEVSGFHNWIQFYWQEQRGHVDYRGYLKPKGRQSSQTATTNGDDHILTLQFKWGEVEKFAGTFFIGVSPEFEMALYTMCFLLGEEENDIQLDTGDDVFHVRIKCYRMAKNKIGTTFPEVINHYED